MGKLCLLKDFTQRNTVLPGDHGSVITEQVGRRMDQEIADQFAAGQKAFLKTRD